MSALKPITIIGGGLAGLALGLGLRQRRIPVTLWEASHYPRHRVCGEFISGRGQPVLSRLGLSELLAQAGATKARTAIFFLGPRKSPSRPLSPPALCLSRFRLDALLAARFCETGGELCENQRFRGDASAEGAVRATGRRVTATPDGCRWLGLKVHAQNVTLPADLEMHGLDNGYVGLSRLPDGKVNVCGLFRFTKAADDPRPAVGDPPDGHFRPSLRNSTANTGQPLAQPFSLLLGIPGSPISERLATATFDQESMCAVSGFSLRPQRATACPECCIGDALTMIPPVTGNGMSMAFEAAELALGPLASYSRGEISWPEAVQIVARACDRAFAGRLAWARWLQWLMFTPVLRGTLGKLVLESELVWRLMFARTR